MNTLEIEFKTLENGGVTSPLGFLAAGVVAGLKKSGKPDMALLYSEQPCHFAGDFTSNLFPAAPVVIDRRLCRERATVRAALVNSGVANACTGERGFADAAATAAETARRLGIEPDDVMLGSTGRIGTFLPMDKIFKGIELAVQAMSRDGGDAAAHAIMTTDTKAKQVAVSFQAGGKTVTVGGMTKGAGMIAPHMRPAVPHATMLCYVTTDADASNADLSAWLDEAVRGSYNRITVDNDMSTNDTCLVFANGASGVRIESGSEYEKMFRAALCFVTRNLARRMVMDGEGSTKMVTVCVTGAKDDNDARICAKAIADSMLCKTAWFGCDPNWGRVLAAAGYAGIEFSPENVSLDYNEKPVVRHGMDAGTPEDELAAELKKGDFTLKLDLGEGHGEFYMWTSDISYDYVKINADYHT